MISIWPDEILSRPTQPWLFEDPKQLDALLERMQTWMTKSNGVGIAAPQIGAPYSVIMVRDRVLINPELVELSDTLVRGREGCLSLPGSAIFVTRPDSAHVKYRDEKGEAREVVFDGAEARIFCHEWDHLQGKTILEYASQLVKDITKKKARTFVKKLYRELLRGAR